MNRVGTAVACIVACVAGCTASRRDGVTPAPETLMPARPADPAPVLADPAAAAAPGPRVHMPSPVIDLGTHLDTEVLTTEAVIENVGDAVLELVYTQPGVSFAADATLVEPGEAYRAPVAVDLNRRPGGPNEVQLRWFTNDPENRFVVIKLGFHVRPVVDITIMPLEPGS